MACIRPCIRRDASVDPDGGSGHHAFEVDKDMLASAAGGKLETAAVERDEFIALLIKTVPGKRNIRVRDDDLVKLGVIEILVVAAFHNSAGCTATCGSWAGRGVRRRWNVRLRTIREQRRV